MLLSKLQSPLHQHHRNMGESRPKTLHHFVLWRRKTLTFAPNTLCTLLHMSYILAFGVLSLLLLLPLFRCSCCRRSAQSPTHRVILFPRMDDIEAEWIVDRFGNSKRSERVIVKERELFGNGLVAAPHASHIEASLHAMRQTHEKHRAGEAVCPHTGRVFRNHSSLRKYHASLATLDRRTGLPTITDETIRANSVERPGTSAGTGTATATASSLVQTHR